jgi:hypothetical protein
MSLLSTIVDRIEDYVMPAFMVFVIPAFIVIALIGLLILGGMMIYSAVTAETFSLQKDSWICTKSHDESVVIYQQTGKIMVPIVISDTVCDQWTHK